MENDKLEFKDDFITSVLKHSDRKELLDDFENALMDTVHTSYAYKKVITGILKKSMFYFFTAILLIGLFSLVVILDRSIFKSLAAVVPVIVLFFSILGSVVFFTNYKRFFQSVLW